MSGAIRLAGIDKTLFWLTVVTPVIVLALVFAMVLGHGLAVAGGIAFVLLAIIAIQAPRLAWALYFFFVTANGLSFEIGAASVRLEFLAFPLLLGAILRSRSVETSSGKTPPAALTAAALWLASTFVSSLMIAPDAGKSLWVWSQWVIGVSAYLAVTRATVDRVELYRVGTLVLTVVTVVTSLGMGGAPEGDGRLSGLSLEPNIFAAQCVGWLALSYYWRGRRPLWCRWCDLVLVMGVVMAGTRSAWLALAVLAAFAVYSAARHRATAAAAFGVAAAVFIPVLLATGSIPSSADAYDNDFAYRLTHLLDTEGGTGGYRLDIYGTAFADMLTRTAHVFGTGANSFSQFHLIDSTNTGAAYLSSVWLAVVYDGGILGALGFFTLLWLIWHRAERPRDALPLVVVLLVCATATNSFWFSFVWVYLALLQPSSRSPLGNHIQPGIDNRKLRKQQYAKEIP